MAFVMQESGSNQLMPSAAFSEMLGAGDAVSVGGGAGGGAAVPFELSGRFVVNCGMLFGRTWVECGDAELEALSGEDGPAGVIYASVSHPPGEAPSLSVGHADELPENGLDVTNRPLYYGEPGGWRDVRLAATAAALL